MLHLEQFQSVCSVETSINYGSNILPDTTA